MAFNSKMHEYNRSLYTINTENTVEAGVNGLYGFKQWECYMLVKYGKSGQFGLSGDYEYLIEMPLYPDEVQEQISATWQTQNILGRSAPISAYAGTSLKSASFSLTLHRDLMTGSFSHTETTMSAIQTGTWRNPATGKDEPVYADVSQNQIAGSQAQTAKGPFGTRSWYTSMNKMLQISCYPQYTNNGLIPPTTYFVFGQMILKGYVETYNTTWQKPILNSFYGWNTVGISMLCYPDSIISARNIITSAGDGSASTQNTYNTLFPDKSAYNSNVMKRNETMNRNNLRNENSLGGIIRDV